MGALSWVLGAGAYVFGLAFALGLLFALFGDGNWGDVAVAFAASALLGGVRVAVDALRARNARRR